MYLIKKTKICYNSANFDKITKYLIIIPELDKKHKILINISHLFEIIPNLIKTPIKRYTTQQIDIVLQKFDKFHKYLIF
jgi:hypothetical protein